MRGQVKQQELTPSYRRLFRQRLLRWYSQAARDLPWRRTNDPYAILVSEIMLQQTQVKTVVPYFIKFIRAFPTVSDLANAPLDRIFKHWEGLGYYRRARYLHAAAQVICRGRVRTFPETAEDWQKLPGVGPYTAGAIASIANGSVTPVVDGNVKRVFARLFCIGRSVDDEKTTAFLWNRAAELVSPKAPGDYNQALMELGASLCLPRKAKCEHCPVRQLCQAYSKDQVERFPVRKAKKKIPHYDVVVALLQCRGKVLLGKRPAEVMLGNTWELPGGKVKAGESLTKALQREIKEELGIVVRPGEALQPVRHTYSHFSITLHGFLCSVQDPQGIITRFHRQIKWMNKKSIDRHMIPTATRKLIQANPTFFR